MTLREKGMLDPTHPRQSEKLPQRNQRRSTRRRSQRNDHPPPKIFPGEPEEISAEKVKLAYEQVVAIRKKEDKTNEFIVFSEVRE
jgi:hypothetical protein